jgi:hypothetical protein
VALLGGFRPGQDPKTWKNASYGSCRCSGHSNAQNANGPYVLAAPSGSWTRVPGPGSGSVDSLPQKFHVKFPLARARGLRVACNLQVLAPNLEIVDSVRIPAGLAPGDYVLQWRWDVRAAPRLDVE